MSRDSIAIDVASAPAVGDLAEHVARTGVTHVLMRDGEALAVVRPIPNKKRRRPTGTQAAPSQPNAWLEDLIGIGSSTGPGDVSANIHRYVADAIQDSFRSSDAE